MGARKLLAYSRIFRHWRGKTLDPPYAPEDISIELTNTCNFKCAFCPQSDPHHFDDRARTLLSPDQAGVILGRLRRGGVRTDVIHWTLDGEPFVNRDIDAICRVALGHGFRFFIFATNGFFLSPERLASLPREDGADYTLCVDFCADRDYFETYRGTKTSWERVRNNIRRALESDLSHIRFELTDISSFTETDRDVLQDRMGALQALFPPGRVQYRSRVFHNMAGFLPGFVERKKETGHGRYFTCPYPWASLVVASNGDVVACCRDLEHRTVLGNLFQEDLEAIWRGPRYRELRKNLAEGRPQENAACRNCDFPYDAEKLSLAHMARRAVQRLGVLK